MLAPRTLGASAAAKAAPLVVWPPVLVTWGPGGRSAAHAHHSLHAVLARSGALRVTDADGREHTAAGVVTSPDATHAIDAAGNDVVLVFVDPESELGAALVASLEAPLRLLRAEHAAPWLAAFGEALEQPAAVQAWAERFVADLAGHALAARRVHPRVRTLLRRLHQGEVGLDASAADLAQGLGLSESRLVHVFSESTGLPLRTYLLWAKLQRAAAVIATGAPFTDAAVAAGFADAAHMTRTFRRMFGVTPTELRRALEPGA